MKLNKTVINSRIPFFRLSSEWMQVSWLTFLLSDWNLNSKQDSQSSMSQYVVSHAFTWYSQYLQKSSRDWLLWSL